MLVFNQSQDMRQNRGGKMVNINKLKGKIVESGLSMEILAKKIGINKSTLYRKINGKGNSFSIKEADLIVETLALSQAEAIAIFFAQLVA